MLETSEVLKVVFGHFDGQNFISEDGQTYPVSPNYASKSHLVEGDELKLSVLANGNLMYKQIKPVNRIKFLGEIHQSDETSEITIFDPKNGYEYKVILSSITYFKLKRGDQVTAVTSETARWAAVVAVVSRANGRSPILPMYDKN